MFSLNIFVPEGDEDLVQPVKRRDNRRNRKFESASKPVGGDELDQKTLPASLEKKKEDVFASDDKPISIAAATIPTTVILPAAAAIPMVATATVTATSEDKKPHSRKNPESRPTAALPEQLLRQVAQAPKEVTESQPSMHLFNEESDFGAFDLQSDLVQHLHGPMKLTRPTRIQSLAIPKLLQGSDCLIRSETGSGKTLCFVLPIVQQLIARPERVSRNSTGVFAVMLSPTRELCTQILQVMQNVSKPYHWIVSTALVGGEKKKSEKARLKRGVNVIVATPGRLADHLRTTESLQDTTQGLKWIVLDEADRLLDTGFEKQIQEILSLLDQVRVRNGTQMVLLSATITQQVEKLAGGCLLHNPCRLDSGAPPLKSVSSTTRVETEQQVVETDGQFNIPNQLVQHFCVVDSADRLVSLAAFIRRHIRRTGNTCKMLVFVNTRACAEFYHKVLSTCAWTNEDESHSTTTYEGLGTKWYVLHGSVDQNQRKKCLKDFSQVRGGVLICTDVAARGLDVPNVDLVIQFDPPSEVSEYVHRIGRTARKGARGAAVLFLRSKELAYLDVLKSHGIKSISAVKLTYDSLLTTMKGQHREAGYEARQEMDKQFQNAVKSDPALLVLAKQAYQSWVSGYAVHSLETKHIFVPRELHFGHVAKSFALKEIPTKINDEAKEENLKKRQSSSSSSAPGNNAPLLTIASKQEQYAFKQGALDLRQKRLKTFSTRSEFEA
ncbi:hypothetical protein BASA81_007359 [Batrachochytrium salamandrivorans]|nr:hypothetical protein BASA81_007359 [Batrachochytrium salamandrivorans]